MQITKKSISQNDQYTTISIRENDDFSDIPIIGEKPPLREQTNNDVSKKKGDFNSVLQVAI